MSSDRNENGDEALGIQIVRGFANHPILISLTPLDADGITKIDKISYSNKLKSVNFENENLPSIKFNLDPIRATALPISKGHAGRLVIDSTADSEEIHCEAGLASWAAEFPVRANPLFTIKLMVMVIYPHLFQTLKKFNGLGKIWLMNISQLSQLQIKRLIIFSRHLELYCD